MAGVTTLSRRFLLSQDTQFLNPSQFSTKDRTINPFEMAHQLRLKLLQLKKNNKHISNTMYFMLLYLKLFAIAREMPNTILSLID